MKQTERGFLLLTSPLGDPLRKPLTVAQFRTLVKRAGEMIAPNTQRDMTLADLTALGYDNAFAYRVLHLLSQEDLLDHYLSRCHKAGCVSITRISDGYPPVLRKKLDPDSPPSLWIKGDISLLTKPMIALVGSREINPENRSFALEVGIQAAQQGYVLVSGNARGADKIAQNACRKAGGQVIAVVADELEKQPLEENVLYISEDGFDVPFSAQRAISRNRVIHALAEKTFVAQCSFGYGGTWNGTIKNLRSGWSPVFCFADGSEATEQLTQRGAKQTEQKQLQELFKLEPMHMSLFDQ